MRFRSQNAARWTGAMATIGCLGLAVAGCGSSSDTSSTNADSGGKGVPPAAKATFDSYNKPISSFVGGPRASVTPPAQKTITIVTCGSQGITCVRVANGAMAAAKALGYRATVVDGQSQPTVWNQAIRNAVSSKADGVVLAAVPAPLVTGALATAKAAKIPVAATLDTSGAGLTVKVNYDRRKVAIANAAFIAHDSGGKAKVLELSDFTEFPNLKVDAQLWKSQLESACGGSCSVAKRLDFTLALASQRLAGDVAQALRSNPSIKYVTQPFDTITPFVQQGIRQSGRAAQVKIVGVGGDPPSVKAITSGDMVESLGTPAEWMGWQAVDGLVRVMAGKPLPPEDPAVGTNYSVPLRYITRDNLPGAAGWQGDFDYQSAFKRLWQKP